MSDGEAHKKFWQILTEMLPEIKDVLKPSKHTEYTKLDDQHCLLDLSFLTDLTGLLNELNTELQHKN